MKKSDARFATAKFVFDACPGQLQHPRACIHTIDLDSRMEPQQFTKKPSIPLAHNQGTPRSRDLSETRHAATLEVMTKGDPFQRPIPRRDRVEAHAFMTKRISNGVSRTRSARAVR